MKKIFDWIKGNKLLLVILTAATLLRLLAVNPGFHPYHNDESTDYSGAISMIMSKTLDPGRYGYPGFLPTLDAFLFMIFFVPLYLINFYFFRVGTSPINYKSIYSLWEFVINTNQQTHVLFWARYITVAFGVGVIFLVYKLSLKLFKNKNIAIVASLLTAVNYRQVLNSHLALPDIYNAFFILLSLYLIIKILDKQSIKNYIFAGIGIALYFCIKFHVYAILPFVFIHLYVVYKELRYKKFKWSFWKKIISGKLLIGITIIPIIVLIFNPFHFIHLGKFLSTASDIAIKYNFGTKQVSYYILFYLYEIGIGKLISLMVILGIIISLRKYLFSTLFLFSLLLPFFYIFAYFSNGGYYPRNFITVTPILLMFAAVFIYEVTNFIFGKMKFSSKYLVLVLVFVGLVLSFGQIKNSIISTYFYTKPWGFEEASRWATLNIPNDVVLVSHQWDKFPADKVSKVVPLDPSGNITEMRESGAQYAYINLDWMVIYNVWWINNINRNPSLFSNMRKVDAILGNSYSGIAIKELASWSIASFVKSWQAPDMNTLIIKIPEDPKIKDKTLLASYNFNSEDEFEEWNLIDGDKGKAKLISFSQDEGKNQEGSLLIKSGSRKVGVIAGLSPLIRIDDEHAYVVEGWVKPNGMLKKEKRDGVIRVDFFNEKPNVVDIYSRSDYQAISSRVYGDGNWVLKKITVVPPEGSIYMSVGLQTSGELDFWLDDITIYESKDEFKDPRKQLPYINYHIPDRILIPSTAEF
ncbi:MAG: glycosyltransferase family 39 protein [bacterium]